VLLKSTPLNIKFASWPVTKEPVRPPLAIAERLYTTLVP
jgi:hypothetical protein